MTTIDLDQPFAHDGCISPSPRAYAASIAARAPAGAADRLRDSAARDRCPRWAAYYQATASLLPVLQ